MSLEDPFFVVKDEVTKALNRTRGLYQHWQHLRKEGIVFSKDEVQKTTAELRNSIRSIEWDLEDLEDTIAIVEKNPSRFRLNSAEVVQRRFFVQQTRDEIGNIKEKLQIMRGQDFDQSAKKPLLENSSPIRHAPKNSSAGYVRIPIQGDQEDGDDDRKMKSVLQQQASLVKQQDEQLVLISGSVGTLKSMSRRIGSELDEQALILDDMGHEMENTETKMDSTLKKMAKVLRMSNDRRQWIAIGILTGLMVIVIILFYVL
ncbi:hypothetical protein DAPPUDRAFT_113324 [Daphnia pulex]|uniref:t-SNARE coiled-coil homology domain-containing protein n=1 Tax=Daphnia pulex TaxID=6669 RepID=E9HEQ5_DAPPU|nr:hypothetical protein DAPPUDRAFT_113324 [Daphnia pulex]|eukprot:EFX69800.1 hypothetical protein DAPPUDRAFT_113324 [Daphnia pulex]